MTGSTFAGLVLVAACCLGYGIVLYTVPGILTRWISALAPTVWWPHVRRPLWSARKR